MSNETRADIIREMRDLGALDEQCGDMIPRSLQALGLRTYAARLEAAAERERVRAEAMRHALERILDIEGYGAPLIEVKCIAQKALEGQQCTPPIAQERPKIEQPGNAAVMRAALARIENLADDYEQCVTKAGALDSIYDLARAALSAPPRKGRWENGRSYEYEYAYCSECGRMQWAGWDTHRQAEENIESFADNYRFCPGCGAEMEGGVYVK